MQPIQPLLTPVPDGTLPGEMHLAGDLLDQAVVEINRIHTQKGLELARALGRYLVRTFFGGSLRSFRERQSGHTTFRALARRTDLHLSYSTLWTSVAVLEQLNQLPEHVGRCLSYSHHRALLPVKDLGVKIRLARRVVDEELTTRQLDSLIRERLCARSGVRTGRPRIPAVVKGIRAVEKGVSHLVAEEIDEGWFASREPDELRALLAGVNHSVSALHDVAELLQRYVERDEECEEAS